MTEKNKYKKSMIQLLLVAVILATVGVTYGIYHYSKKPETKKEIKTEEVAKVQSEPEPKKAESVAIKDSAVLPVPYTLQGPLNNLSIHEESCEEAAALMYHYFLESQYTFNGSTVIPPQKANDEMLAMKAWQVKNYGSEPDLSIEALGKFMKDYYGYSYQVFKDITPEDIKREISAGHPVLVPVMTHHLKNPMYGPQTTYHILVIKGYNTQNVITNDAGVRGEGQEYSWDILFSAIDAQTPKMGQGREMVIVTK